MTLQRPSARWVCPDGLVEGPLPVPGRLCRTAVEAQVQPPWRGYVLSCFLASLLVRHEHLVIFFPSCKAAVSSGRSISLLPPRLMCASLPRALPPFPSGQRFPLSCPFSLSQSARNTHCPLS